MIVLDVELNGRSYCRAGIDGHGVISVMLHWVDIDGEAVFDDPGHPRAGLTLSVAGHRAARAYTAADVEAGREPPPMAPVHWRDVRRGLQAGDEVRVRIVEAEAGAADLYTETPMLPPEDG
jgi:hypothetical protein